MEFIKARRESCEGTRKVKELNSSSKNCYFVIDTQHKFNSQDLIVNSPLKLPRVTL